MKNSFCTVIAFTSFTYYHFYFIASLSFWLPKRYYCFFFRILILNAIFNFQFFYWCFISNNYCLQMLYTLTYYYCFSTIDGFVVFHYVRELLFFPKTLLCLHLHLSSRGVLSNECSLNIQKLSKKYISEWTHFWLKCSCSACDLTFTGKIKFIGIFQEFSWSL